MSLFTILPSMAGKKIILASGSPRRKQMFDEVLRISGLYMQIPSKFDEDAVDVNAYAIEEYTKMLAQGKAEYVVNDLRNEGTEFDYVIGCDTMVVFDHHKLGKPKTDEKALEMLSLLSGRDHEVISGVSIFPAEGEPITFTESTRVFFKDLTVEEIQNYVDSKEPHDKAGGYGIQGLGGIFIEKIEGCFYNVMGFPIHRFYDQLRVSFSEQ
ncbi:hypothetical protein PCE1_004782 [Barthelona sp. PCE]